MVAALLTSWGAFTGQMWTNANQDLREDVLRQAALVAQAVPSEHIASLHGALTDLGNPAYLRLKEQITGMRAANPKFRFVYLMGQRPNGDAFVLVDSEPIDSPDYSSPGQAYPEASKGLLSLLAGGKEPFVVGPVNDRWGSWVSALIPMSSGKAMETAIAPVAVLGLDMEAETWKREVALRTAIPSGLFLLITLLHRKASAKRSVAKRHLGNAVELARG